MPLWTQNGRLITNDAGTLLLECPWCPCGDDDPYGSGSGSLLSGCPTPPGCNDQFPEEPFVDLGTGWGVAAAICATLFENRLYALETNGGCGGIVTEIVAETFAGAETKYILELLYLSRAAGQNMGYGYVAGEYNTPFAGWFVFVKLRYTVSHLPLYNEVDRGLLWGGVYGVNDCQIDPRTKTLPILESTYFTMDPASCSPSTPPDSVTVIT